MSLKMEALQKKVIKDILKDSFVVYLILLFSMFHLSSSGDIKINEWIFYPIVYFAIQYSFVIIEVILSFILFYLKRVKKISSHFLLSQSCAFYTLTYCLLLVFPKVIMIVGV